MKLRDIERGTTFSKKIEEECNIHNMQGVCKYNDKYTLMYEAIDIENNNPKDYKILLPDEEVYIKSCFAEQVGCPFAIFLHKQHNKENFIWVGIFSPDHENKKSNLIEVLKFNENDFIQWWKTKKTGKQTKFYRPNMNKAISNSYFDQLFEKNGSSWGTNIDGFIVGENESRDVKILAIVENRFSSKEDLEKYDPARYYQPSDFNAGDYRTWNSLTELKNMLNIPLFLFTFSRASGMEEKIGLAEVELASPDVGLKYKNLAPNYNVKTSVQEVKEWIKHNINH